MMGRAVLFHGAGRPLELVRYRVPEPAAGEMLVRVSCCTLCRSDLHTHAGRRIEPTPIVLGHEIVGRIEAFGPSAATVDARGVAVAIGDRVSWSVVVGCGDCFFCREHLPQKCARLFKYGHHRADLERPLGGGLAEHVLLVPGTTWLRVPDAIPDAVAASANCATATAAGLLRNAGALAGRSVLVLGAGMLGVTACAMARIAGASAVIAADVVPDALARARRFGATHAFTMADPAEEVAEATAGRGADVAVELAGTASSVEAGLRAVRIGGTLLLAGTVAPVGTVALDPEMIVRRMLTVRGVHNYAACDLAAALDFLAGPGRDFPFADLLGPAFPLEQAEQAFARAHAHPGKRVAIVAAAGLEVGFAQKSSGAV